MVTSMVSSTTVSGLSFVSLPSLTPTATLYVALASKLSAALASICPDVAFTEKCAASMPVSE